MQPPRRLDAAQAARLHRANAPRVEVGNLAGNNATFSPADGPNGVIRINADLIGGDPARRGQLEAFAVWGHMEEVGHWADARAHSLMGRPGGDSAGDEGAHYASLAMGGVAEQARAGTVFASYGIPVSGGPARTVEVDTVVLKALAAEKLANGSFARENRVGNVESFGPEGHYQTTYITAIGAGNALGLPARDVDRIANRLALGSQLPDMLANFDAVSRVKAKAADLASDVGRRLASGLSCGWSPVGLPANRNT